jgi:transposase
VSDLLAGSRRIIDMQIRSVGIDLGKTTFHVVALNAAGKVLLRKKFTQKQLITFTANMQTSWIGMEACSGAHFLGRVLREQGHDVKLIPAQFVKPSEEAACAWCSIRRPPRQARTIAVRSLAQRS